MLSLDSMHGQANETFVLITSVQNFPLYAHTDISTGARDQTFGLSIHQKLTELSLSHWYPGSGVVLDCIDSRSLHPYFLCKCKQSMLG